MDQRAARGVCAGLVLLAVTVWAAGHLFAQQRVDASRPAAISGTVVDAANGNPIAGAQVQVSLSTGAPLATLVRQITDRRGRFVFMDLPVSDSATLSATASGYSTGGYGLEDGVPGDPIRFPLTADQWMRDVEIRLTRLATVSGFALDEQNEPLVGVWVRLLTRRHVAGQAQWIAGPSSRTDDRGMFRIPAVPDGAYVAMLISPMATMAPDAPGTQLGVAPTLRFDGLSSLMPAPARTDLLQTHADGLRVVLGHGVPAPARAADGIVRVYPTTFHPGVTTVEAAAVFSVRRGQDVAGLTIVAAPVAATSVSGVIAAPAGTSWHGRVLRLVPPGLSGIIGGADVASTTVRNDGTFTFPLVPEGDYLLDAPATFLELSLTTERGGESPPAPVGLRYGSANSGALAAFPPLSYSSRRTSLPELAWLRQPVSVGRRPIEGLVASPQATLTITGVFEFEGTTSATVERATFGGGGASSGGAVTMTTSQPSVLRLVLEPATGETWLGMPSSELSDEPMAFLVSGVRPGRYVIRSGNAPRHAIMQATLDGKDVTLGFDATELTGRETLVVRMTDKLATVSGTVIAAPNTTGAVYLFPSDPAAWNHIGLNPPNFKRSVWQAGQPFTIAGLPAGEYLVIALAREVGPQEWTSPAWLSRAAPLASRVTVSWEQTSNVSLSPAPGVSIGGGR
jgi:hypothetical protein